MSKSYTFHVISNTHWDREWRFPFQKNRQMLVAMIDRVLEILESDPEYRAFHLDSQSVVLQDYLEIKPHNRARIQKQVAAGRLLIGPWFILPDEFQVGGESLIRNLLLGHRICREFGHVMKVGYSPFSWGQISQLPQIYKEFGIDLIMFYRGINSLDSPKAEFIWEGADGTRTLSSRFSTMPRYNFYFYIYRPVLYNEQPGDLAYDWQRDGLPFHFADQEQHTEDYHLLLPEDSYYPENIQPSVGSIMRDQIDDFTTGHIFWAEGHDSSGPNPKTPHIIHDINAILDNGTAVHSTLEDYARAIHRSVEKEKLPIVRGERRSSQYDHRSGNLYGYTTSARMYLKQLNFQAERSLLYYAEPLRVIAELLGMDTNNKYLEKAWNLLLQNSAHDSIGGCSLDEIHEDMVSRYKHIREISNGVFQRSCQQIAKHIAETSGGIPALHLAVINPLTFDRATVLESFIDIPKKLDLGQIEIHDSDGKQLDFQLIDRRAAEPVLEQLIDRPMYFEMVRYHGFIGLPTIPAMGYSTFQILPTSDQPDELFQLGRIQNHLPVLENDSLRVSVQANGTLSIEDKENKQQFSDIGYLLDEGEAGHAWTHIPVDPVIDSRKFTPEIEILENGPLRSSIRIRHRLPIPRNLEDRKSLPANCPELPVQLDVILMKNARRIEFEIELDNTMEDHRLRLMFPTGIEAQYSYGEGQFDVVARPAVRPDTHDWIEQPMYDYPLHNFVDISDGKRGAAVLVEGLKEYEFLPDSQHTLALTLLRAFRYVIQPSSVQDYGFQKGSQCPGKHRYRLAFYPHAENWSTGRVYPEALDFNVVPRAFQFGGTVENNKSSNSFFRISPANLIFSALKASDDGQQSNFILRFYNPTDHEILGKVESFFPILKASRVTMEEREIEILRVINQHRIEVTVPARKIHTLRLDLKSI